MQNQLSKSFNQNSKRWVLLLIVMALPLVLMWIIAAKNSWRPRVLQVNWEYMWVLAFSPDGARLICSGLDSGKLQIWDIRSRKPVKTYENLVVYQAEFISEDQLAASNYENTWRLNLQQQKLKPLLTFTRNNGENKNPEFENFGSMKLLTGGKTLAFTGTVPGDDTGCRMILYHATTGKRQRTLDFALPPSRHPQIRTAETIECSPDGALVAAGGVVSTPNKNSHTGYTWLGGEVWVWDKTGHLKHKLTGHTWQVNIVTFSPQGNWLATACDAGGDNSVRIWNLRTGKLLHALPAQPDGIHRIAFAPDGQTLLVVSGDANTQHTLVMLWDTKSGKLMRTVLEQESQVNSVTFSPDGSDLAIASENKTIKVFRVK